jgi:fengycin family lipopeptide synthetase D
MPLAVTGNESTGDVTYELSKALSLKIEALSKQYGLTTNSILQSIWALLLSYFKSTDNITYGLTFSHRPYELDQIADCVGLFINTLPIGLTVDLNSKWLDFAYLLQSENADLMQKASVSLSDLASHIEPYAISDFIDELFVYENMPLNDITISTNGLKNMRSVETADVRFVTVIAPGNEYQIRYIFNQIFTLKMIKNWHEIFVNLLEQIIENPHLSIKQISFLTADQGRTIENYAGTPKEYSYHNIKKHLVHEYLIHTATLCPDATAIVDDEGQYTYAELLSVAKKVKTHLIAAGLKPGERVAVHLERGFYLIAVLYGVLMSGGVLVPLEKDNPSPRKNQIIATSRARLVLTDDEAVFHEAETLKLEELLRTGLTEIPYQLDLTSQDLAYIIFTSGSTGIPKGVAISHESAFNLVGPLNEILKLNKTSRLLMFASISFDAAVGDWITSVAHGCCLYISNRKALLHPNDFINYINENKIDTVTLPPSYLSILDESKLKNLKTVVSAGEPCPLNVIKTWSQDRNFFNGYGPTETTVFATFSKCVSDQSTVSIGTPAFNKKIYIVDPYLRPVPPGVIGEICISGMGIAEGYWDMPELTKEKFIINPFNPQLRMYKTGDLGRWLENGEIDYLGRRDNQLKIRGYRVELEEIKMAIESHPKVSQSYISCIEEGNEKELVAHYISTEYLTDSLASFLSEKLPGYMLPKYFIKMDKFELTVNGKIDTMKLPAPTRAIENLFLDHIDHDVIYQLEKIFSEQLNMSCATTDNYFNYGLHSLLLIKIINEIDKKFNYRVPVKIFYECNTIYDLAKFLSKKIDDERTATVNNNAKIEEFIL